MATMTRSYYDTFRNPTFTRSSDGGKMPNTGGWQDRHLAAIRVPSRSEENVGDMIGAWAQYADSHKARFESGIGQDYVLGPAWAGIGVSLLTLLNGECGRFDCGTLDGFIRDTMEAEGFNDDGTTR